MKAKVIFVAGVPASGKTTIFRKLREALFDDATEFMYGKARGIERGAYQMLGVFDGSTFEGTDRLSMTVIDDAIAYIQALEAESKQRKVIFVEGDRLFNYRFLQAVRASVILIDASPEVLMIRHAQRGDTQTEVFLRGRRSKVENFAKKYRIGRVYNNTPEDSERITKCIIQMASKWICGQDTISK